MDAKTPKVFISYSWDSEEHKEWVRSLAVRLRNNGLEAIIDQWFVRLGEELTAFMEKAIRESDFVILVCTPQYKAKADARRGGVGYEGAVITGEIAAGVERRKFVPIFRSGSVWKEAAPSWCLGSLMVDMRNDPTDAKGFSELLQGLWGEHPQPPPLGSSPFKFKGNSPNPGAPILPSPNAPSQADSLPIKLDDKSTDWAEVKRLIIQSRPIMRQEGLNRWNALAASGHIPPPDVVKAVEDNIIDSATNDEAAHKLLLQLTNKESPETRSAITRLTYALADGAFSSRTKTGLSLSYSATTVPEAREQLLLWLEKAQSARDVETGLAALVFMTQSFSPELEPLYGRIERICQKFSGHGYAQNAFKLLTGKDLSPPDSAVERASTLNVPKGFNLNAARYRAMKDSVTTSETLRRSRVLAACYDTYMVSPAVWIEVLDGIPEDEREDVVREVEGLARQGYIKADVASDHTSASVQLTPAGRIFVEGTSTSGSVSEEHIEMRNSILAACYAVYMKSSSAWIDVLHDVSEDQRESVVREVQWLAYQGYVKASVAADHTSASVQLTPSGRDFFEKKSPR